MTTKLHTVDEVLSSLQSQLDELDIRRTQTNREGEAHVANTETLAQHMSAIQTAATALASLPSPDDDQEWLDRLNRWRKPLCDELLQIKSPVRDPRTQGVQRNLMLSIRCIDFGTGEFASSGYSLETSRLGELMMQGGFQLVGADERTNAVGTLPWFGGVREVEKRLAKLNRRRVEAQAALDEAMLDDATRAKRDADAKARREAANAQPVMKTRGDGSQYLRYPDGRRVEVIDEVIS